MKQKQVYHETKRIDQKIGALLLTMCLLILSCCSGFATAPDSIVVKVQDETLLLSSPAYLYDTTAMLPLRDMAEQFGYTISWADTINSAVILSGEDEIAVVTAGIADYTFHEEIFTAAQPAALTNDRLYAAVDIIEKLSGLTASLHEDTGILYFNNPSAMSQEEGILNLLPTEDTYVQGGNTADTNFGTSDQLDFKAGSGAVNRLIYLKFNLKDIDFDFEEAHFSFLPLSAENRLSAVTVYVYESDPNSWSEKTLTFNNQPEHGELIQTVDLTFSPYPVSIDLTQYIQKIYAEHKQEIALVLDGNYLAPLRMTFASKEHATAEPPTLHIAKSAAAKIEQNLSVKEGFGEGQDPWIWAEKMWTESQFQKISQEKSSNVHTLEATASVYANSGQYKGTNFAGEQVMQIKSDPETTNTARKSYVKFALSSLPAKDFSGAYLDLFCTAIQDNAPHFVTLCLVDNNWEENTLTWDNKPKDGAIVAQEFINSSGSKVRFDLSEIIQEALEHGEQTISFSLLDTAQKQTMFATRYAKNGAPTLTVSYAAPSSDGVQPVIPNNRFEEYDLTVNVKRYNTSNYVSYPTRVIESLPNYSITAKEPRLSQYGGCLDYPTQEATGFYYTKQIGGRWWIIDPEGHPMINAAVVTVRQPGTPAETAGLQAKFGTLENWAKETTDILRNDLYFNGVGAWSTTEYLDQAEHPLASANLVYFLATYMGKLNLRVPNAGSTGFANGTFSVFDPDFVTFCDEYAKENIAPKKDSHTVLAWMSDNELPASLTMLDDLLNLDPSDPINAYSYATAWTFVRKYTGKDHPSLSDINNTMREDFRDFIYDRYFKVISEAIRKHDPNHMYMGCRFHAPSIDSRGCWSAAGRYCDIVSVNYYDNWTPNSAQMRNWYSWTDKPFIATEWYAMGYDSGLTCSSGAGFRVDTQQNRGLFYQNFVLKLLETQSCVGFHWFQYQDNDPTATNRDSSNIDGNKGIVNTQFELYEPLINEMAELNRNLYPLINYFDQRNS